MVFTKLQKAGLLVLLALLYLLVGLSVPLLHTPTLTEQTKEQISVEQFYGDADSVDRAMLLESNQSAWTERIRLLNQADEQIILTTFDMRDCNSTRDLLAVLLQKANEGVEVKILVDGLNGWYHLEQSPIFRAVATHEHVQIKLYNPIDLLRPWINQYRLHDKYIIVDDLGYILGGRNTHDYFIGQYDTDSRSLDREVLVYNTQHQAERSGESSLFQLQQYFDDIWNDDSCQFYGAQSNPSVSQQKLLRDLQEHYMRLLQQHSQLFQDLDFIGRTVPVRQIQLLYNDPGLTAKEPVLFYQLCQLMGQAQQQVTFFSPYAVCNGAMLQQLQQVAQQVEDCRLVVNSVENGDNFIASSDYLRHKEEILQSGFAVYEYDGGNSMHGKSLTIDDRFSVIGSFTMDLRSTYLSTETMLVIDSPALTAQLNQNFQALERQSRQLVGEDSYIIPAELEIAPVSRGKRIAWWIVGLLLQPFRLTI